MANITPPFNVTLTQTGTSLNVSWMGHAARFRLRYRASGPTDAAWTSVEQAAGGAVGSGVPLFGAPVPVPNGGGSTTASFTVTLVLGTVYDIECLNLAEDGTAFSEDVSTLMAHDPLADFGVDKVSGFKVLRALTAEIVVGWDSTGVDRPYVVHMVELDEFNRWREIALFEVDSTQDQLRIPAPLVKKYALYVAQWLYEASREGIVSDEVLIVDLCTCEDTGEGGRYTTTTTTFAPTTTTTTPAPTTTTTTPAPTTTTTTADPCPCGAGYTANGANTACVLEEETAPTITSSEYCFAPSNLANQYAIFGTKLFDPGYDVGLATGALTLLTTTPQWKDGSGTLTGPFNRRGIWVDTDCDGVKDALSAGAVIEFTHLIVATVPRTVYVGIAGDNRMVIKLNGTVLVDRTAVSGDVDAFRYWHVVPVDLIAGNNYINFKGVGDGSVNDAIGAAIYDNTAAEMIGATDDSQLTILFDTADLICTTPPTCPKVQLATCDEANGWFLDTSGGVGSYVCRRITEAPCGGPYPCGKPTLVLTPLTADQLGVAVTSYGDCTAMRVEWSYDNITWSGSTGGCGDTVITGLDLTQIIYVRLTQYSAGGGCTSDVYVYTPS